MRATRSISACNGKALPTNSSLRPPGPDGIRGHRRVLAPCCTPAFGHPAETRCSRIGSTRGTHAGILARAVLRPGRALHAWGPDEQGTVITHLTVHDFPCGAATSIAEYDPAHAGIIRNVLGHATMNIADRHFNRVRSFEAMDKPQGSRKLPCVRRGDGRGDACSRKCFRTRWRRPDLHRCHRTEKYDASRRLH